LYYIAHAMWETALLINSCIWISVATFLIYALGVALLLEGSWKQFGLALLVFVLLCFTQLVMACLSGD
jgi:hypothetical protein